MHDSGAARQAGRAGAVEHTTAEVPFKSCGIGAVTITIAVEVAVARAFGGTGVHNNASSEVNLEYRGIRTVHVLITIKITLTRLLR